MEVICWLGFGHLQGQFMKTSVAFEDAVVR